MVGPLVSVVIPAFNVGAYIGPTLDSATGQSYSNLEIIVIDDGSTDATTEIVRARTAKDRRIRLVRQQHSGVAAARNRGIAEAQGDFIALLDGDDLWHPTKIDCQIRRFAEVPDAGLVYCWSSYIDPRGQTPIRCRWPASFEGDVLAALVFQHFVGNGSTPLIRRSCVDMVWGFDGTLRSAGAEGCEDLKFYLEIAEKDDFAVVPRFLVGYRRHAGAMSNRHLQMIRSHDFILAYAKERWPEIPGYIFRWSAAQVKAHYALRAARAGNWRDALSLSLSAVTADPGLLRSANRCVDIMPMGPSRGFLTSPPERLLIRPEAAMLRRRDHVASIRIRQLQTTAAPRPSLPVTAVRGATVFPGAARLSQVPVQPSTMQGCIE